MTARSMSVETVTSGLDVFYPILPDSQWISRLVPLGIRTVQLRAKDVSDEEIRRQILHAKKVCEANRCQLIVNDYWQAALELGCDYIHLGQEDLASADVAAIKQAGMRLGISTHSADELEIALAARPDYVALGPIYETKLKAMKWSPQGLDRVAAWKARIEKVPLVAIGGITPERASGVMAAGADSAAVITDFMTAQDPCARIMSWLRWAERERRCCKD